MGVDDLALIQMSDVNQSHIKSLGPCTLQLVFVQCSAGIGTDIISFTQSAQLQTNYCSKPGHGTDEIAKYIEA